MCITMFVVALTEQYCAAVHGRTSATSPNIVGRRLVLDSYEPASFCLDPSPALGCLACLTTARWGCSFTQPQLEFVEVERLVGNEDVTVRGPCPITRVQRLWRKIRQL